MHVLCGYISVQRSHLLAVRSPSARYSRMPMMNAPMMPGCWKAEMQVQRAVLVTALRIDLSLGTGSDLNPAGMRPGHT